MEGKGGRTKREMEGREKARHRVGRESEKETEIRKEKREQ